MNKGWWQEMQRRNVVRVGIAYAVMGWIVLQIGITLFETFEAPGWVSKVVVSLIVLGWPFALFFAWAFELTPEGLKRTHEVDPGASITKHTGRKVDYAIITGLVIAVVWLGWDKLTNDVNTDTTAKGIASEPSLPAGGGSKEASIAVLPFADMSPEGDHEFFSDGISEELLNLLARIPDLKVAARTSSFAFKGRNENIGEIAEALKVSKVLEGSVRKSGTKLRITAQLIEADTGYHLWSDTYDRELDDVFAIQDEIAAAIVDALHDTLGLTATAPESVRASSVDAYSAYLEGRQMMTLRSQTALEQSRTAFDKALALDPEFAPAYSSLAETVILLNVANYGDIPEYESYEQAQTLVDRAAELAPDSADTYVARGFLLDQQNRFDEAIAAYDRALELNPNMVRALMWRGQALGEVGRYEEQLASLRQAVALDPLAYVPVQNMAVMMVRHGKTAEALAAMEKLARIRNDPASYRGLALIHFQQGRLDLAHEILVKAHELAPDEQSTKVYFMAIYDTLDLVQAFRPLAQGDLEKMWLLFAERRFEEAAAAGREILSAEPDDSISIPRWLTALAYQEAGQPALALQYFQPLVAQTVGHVGPLFGTGHDPFAFQVLAARRDTGDEKGARRLLEELREYHDELVSAGFKDLDTKFRAAQILALEGRDDEALALLREVVDSNWISADLDRFPALRALRADPVFRHIAADYERERERQRDEIRRQLGLDKPTPARPVI